MTGIGNLLQANGQTLQFGWRQRQTGQQWFGETRLFGLRQVDGVRLQHLGLLGDKKFGQFVYTGGALLGRERLQLTATDTG